VRTRDISAGEAGTPQSLVAIFWRQRTRGSGFRAPARQATAYKMIQRRAKSAGLTPRVGRAVRLPTLFACCEGAAFGPEI